MDKKYYFTVGLEIHAELKTKTKMFCGCKNDPDEEKPNVNICPVCMAHPGALPVINKAAVEHVIKVGLAIDGKIADFTEFDRKNYFYPDIPKGYQISQYKYPIVSGGNLAGFDITRVHLEEDTANNKHDRGDFSLIDFNRAGVPLMELVTEPHTFEDADELAKAASRFSKEYQLLLWYLGVSEANMEKGEMRVEANVSVSDEKDKLNTKVEVKNLNSFRSVERALKYEIERMTELFEEGKEKEIIQETRGWDESKQKTFSQRSKESSEDYRYFPDPDLPKMKLHEAFDLEKMKKDLPESLSLARERMRERGWQDDNIEVLINEIASSRVSHLDSILNLFLNESLGYFNGLPSQAEYERSMENYFFNDVLSIHRTGVDLRLNDAENFSKIITLVTDGKISSRVAKDLISLTMKENNFSPLDYVNQHDLLQKNDEGALKEIAQKIIDANPKVVADYKGGKENALMSLVGQIMKETKGSANPAVAKNVLVNLLK